MTNYVITNRSNHYSKFYINLDMLKNFTLNPVPFMMGKLLLINRKVVCDQFSAKEYIANRKLIDWKNILKEILPLQSFPALLSLFS